MGSGAITKIWGRFVILLVLCHLFFSLVSFFCSLLSSVFLSGLSFLLLIFIWDSPSRAHRKKKDEEGVGEYGIGCALHDG
jgi:hypothetical protein